MKLEKLGFTKIQDKLLLETDLMKSTTVLYSSKQYSLTVCVQIHLKQRNKLTLASKDLFIKTSPLKPERIHPSLVICFKSTRLSILLKSTIFKSKKVTNEKLFIKDKEKCVLIQQPLSLLQTSVKQNHTCMFQGTK